MKHPFIQVETLNYFGRKNYKEDNVAVLPPFPCPSSPACPSPAGLPLLWVFEPAKHENIFNKIYTRIHWEKYTKYKAVFLGLNN